MKTPTNSKTSATKSKVIAEPHREKRHKITFELNNSAFALLKIYAGYYKYGSPEEAVKYSIADACGSLYEDMERSYTMKLFGFNTGKEN